MPPIPILIALIPPMLRDVLLATIAAESDMDVVGVVDDEAAIASELERTGATVMIVDAERRHAAGDRSQPWPRGTREPGVLALTADGREAYLELALGEISPPRLVQTIRLLPTIRSDD